MGCSNPVVGSVVMGCFVDIFYASKVLKSIMLQCNWWVYVLNICKLVYTGGQVSIANGMLRMVELRYNYMCYNI